ncbi:MAG: ABC transporter ATP-binding protein [Lachnospiraceae bacterium]|nr:ABC transporter ATP-binding protein [Lachnospiraceae bacterium]
MIRVNHVTKVYKGDYFKTTALDDVSFEVEDGTFVGILGESGSGKTTLLNLLGGMDRATYGEVLYSDTDIERFSAMEMDRFRKKNIAFVFQNFALMNEFSVYENLEAALLARNYKKKERQRIICDILERFGITELQYKYPGQISGGQKQRVAIARAVIMDCPYILADEPTGALDEENTRCVMELFLDLKKSGKTIVVITHDSVVAGYADCLLTIRDGKLWEK